MNNYTDIYKKGMITKSMYDQIEAKNATERAIMKGMETIMKNGVFGVQKLGQLSMIDLPGTSFKAFAVENDGELKGVCAKGPLVGFTDYADPRYKTPKEEPKVSEALIDKTIMETEIYRRAKVAIRSCHFNVDLQARLLVDKAQRRQVAYGIEKYPEPLNANTWSITETIDHAIDESIDKLHYLFMLRIKFEQAMESSDVMETFYTIDQMIGETVRSLHSLAKIRMSAPIKKAQRNDALDAAMYSVKAYQEAFNKADMSIPGLDTDGDEGYTSSDQDELNKRTDEEVAYAAKKGLDLDGDIENGKFIYPGLTDEQHEMLADPKIWNSKPAPGADTDGDIYLVQTGADFDGDTVRFLSYGAIGLLEEMEDKVARGETLTADEIEKIENVRRSILK